MALCVAASLVQAQPALDSASAEHKALRSATDHALKSHPGTRVPAAIVARPAVFPAAQVAATPEGGRSSPLKGWVLLLMGGFLIATISQRRYQALSDI